jgi:hypothetical protein
MRSLLLLALLSVPAFAGPRTNVECTLDRDPDDIVAKGKDITIEAGQRVKDVIVIDGNVRVKKGASVKTILVTNGTITLEAGARVREHVINIGGTPSIDPKARVKGSRIVVNEGIHLQGDEGGTFDLNLRVDGRPIGEKILAEVLGELRGCKIVDTQS